MSYYDNGILSTTLTYNQFFKEAKRVASLMSQLHLIDNHSKVCIIANNHASTLILYSATLLLGATLIPVDPSLPNEQIRNIIPLGQIRLITSEASALSKDTLKNFYQKYQIPIIQGYGLSKAVNFSIHNGDREFFLSSLTKENKDDVPISINEGHSCYIYVQAGSVKVFQKKFTAELFQGMYACFTHPASFLLSHQGKAIIIQISQFTAMNTYGGPLEPTGRLRYINGCSDTLLLSPSKLGEPCLNLLHFPPHTIQSNHLHPSFRFGIVASGEGMCISQESSQKLQAGDVFFIPKEVEHKFDTHNSVMNIIAFHPDTDFGPTDEVHPMINKTILK